MGGKVGSYLNPVKTFTGATKDAWKQGKILSSGKGKLSNFLTAADDIGSLGLANSMGITKAVTGGGGGDPTPAAPTDPLDFNGEAARADQTAIEAEGARQYKENLDAITQSGTASTQRAKDLFGQMLPDIAENSQASHLYDSTGYGQEVARQESNIASQVADQESQQRLAALGARQGFQTGGVQRVMSLEDYTNQARVAKTLGATVAPQGPSSKATGTSGALAGAGAGATVGTSITPGWGTAIGAVGGGVAGYFGGASAGKKGGK